MANAQQNPPVELKSIDGIMSIVGELISVDGDVFVIETADLGVLRVQKSSVSFRFNTGSSVLDVESIRNIEELAARMEGGEFDGLEVLLVGFADSIGERTRNTALAQARAESVRAILAASLKPETSERLVLEPQSYGELLPLSCNDGETGRARNRRVEVWLRLPDSRSNLR